MPKKIENPDKPTQVRIWPELVPILVEKSQTERRSVVQVVNLILEAALTPKPKKT